MEIDFKDYSGFLKNRLEVIILFKGVESHETLSIICNLNPNESFDMSRVLQFQPGEVLRQIIFLNSCLYHKKEYFEFYQVSNIIQLGHLQ